MLGVYTSEVEILSDAMQLAKLSGEDMNGINNLEYLGVSVSKRQSGVFSLRFRSAQKVIQQTIMDFVNYKIFISFWRIYQK